ncbi:MAG: hypothetical protein Q8P81_01920 [Nanoarchaeota archaeon]|nr:hypothetical protein [Nanoarchaeota archaeon]
MNLEERFKAYIRDLESRGFFKRFVYTQTVTQERRGLQLGYNLSAVVNNMGVTAPNLKLFRISVGTMMLNGEWKRAPFTNKGENPEKSLAGCLYEQDLFEKHFPPELFPEIYSRDYDVDFLS